MHSGLPQERLFSLSPAVSLDLNAQSKTRGSVRQARDRSGDNDSCAVSDKSIGDAQLCSSSSSQAEVTENQSILEAAAAVGAAESKTQSGAAAPVSSCQNFNTTTALSTNQICQQPKRNHHHVNPSAQRINQDYPPSIGAISKSNSIHVGLYSVVDVCDATRSKSDQQLYENITTLNKETVRGKCDGNNATRDASTTTCVNCDKNSEINDTEEQNKEKENAEEKKSDQQENTPRRCDCHGPATRFRVTSSRQSNMEVIYDEPYGGDVMDDDVMTCACCQETDCCCYAGDVTESHSCEYANCGRNAKSVGRKERGPVAAAVHLFPAARAACEAASHTHVCHDKKHHTAAAAFVSSREQCHHQQFLAGNLGAWSRTGQGGQNVTGRTGRKRIASSESDRGLRSSSGSTASGSDRHSAGEAMQLSDTGITELCVGHPGKKYCHPQHGFSTHTPTRGEFLRQFSAPAASGASRPSFSFSSPSCGIRMAEMRAASKRHVPSALAHYYYTLDPDYVMRHSDGSEGGGSSKTSPVYCEITGYERTTPDPTASAPCPGAGTSYESLTESTSGPVVQSAIPSERPPLPPRDYRLSDEYKQNLTLHQQQTLPTGASTRGTSPGKPQRHSSPSPGPGQR